MKISIRRIGRTWYTLAAMLALTLMSAVTLSLSGSRCFAAEGTLLAPGATLRFEFPELPDTLSSMESGKKQPAVLTARLPDNYSLDKKFPVFIYLLGGPGGRGEVRDLELGLSVIGKRDFICVTMPLFKRVWNTKGPARGLFVLPDDFEVISRSYRVMLQKLFATIPNTTSERSVLGGHSNGAHTTGVLLAGQDNFILDHFQAFYLHEGGVMSFTPEVLGREAMKRARFLVIMGGKGLGGKPPRESPFFRAMSSLQESVATNRLDCTFVTMEGYGHEQPPEYLRVIGQWARGEPLDDVPGKIKTLAGDLKLPLKSHPDSANWPELLNADLSNCKVPGGIWKYQEGILTASADQNIWTKNDYSDCVLDLEFKFEPGANSGVFLYSSDATNWMPGSVEIQICDDHAAQWKEKPATWHCGAFFGHQAPLKSAVKPAGEWNRMTITAQGQHIAVLLNGEVVNEINLTRWIDSKVNPDGSEIPNWLHGRPWKVMPANGRIGFQGRHAGAGIFFRNLKVLRLPKKDVSASRSKNDFIACAPGLQPMDSPSRLLHENQHANLAKP